MPTSASAADLLRHWLIGRLDPPAATWLEDRLGALDAKAADRDFTIAFGTVPRRLGKRDLDLTADELAAATAARPGWDPREWSVDQAARIALVLAASGGDGERCVTRLDQLFATADVGELVCLYRGLPLYPEPMRHVARAREGARTNMRAVFEAVAHRNPFPAEQFDDNAWNHMVLKALFVGSRLQPIVGIDRRANLELAVMLRDYAHERWAAGRPVSAELWRSVGRFADDDGIADLARVLAQGDERERRAAALALADSPREAARARLAAAAPDLAAAVRAGTLSWETLA